MAPILKQRIIGNHLWGYCGWCHRWIKLTGFFKGYHICNPPYPGAR